MNELIVGIEIWHQDSTKISMVEDGWTMKKQVLVDSGS